MLRARSVRLPLVATASRDGESHDAEQRHDDHERHDQLLEQLSGDVDHDRSEQECPGGSGDRICPSGWFGRAHEHFPSEVSLRGHAFSITETIDAALVVRLVETWSIDEVVESEIGDTHQGHGLHSRAELVVPRHGEIIQDLALWRERGVLRLRELDLPALRQVALCCGEVRNSRQAAEPSVVTAMVRSALAPIAESVTGRASLILLGLDPTTFDLAPHLLREDAAEVYGVSVARFRRDPQKLVLSLVADRLLERCHDHRLRLERLQMEQRHPADTRLAVKWLERFEQYFAIWTPVYALGADLDAYRSTLLDPERPWDHRQDSNTGGAYSQDLQAIGYGTFALYRLACVLAAEKGFMASHGGLWLLSSPSAEVEARDALRDVTRHVPVNERDASLLRELLAEASGELHEFLRRLGADDLAIATHADWQVWLASCACEWDQAHHDPVAEYFPTSRYQAGIVPECEVHRTIEASTRFCAVIEAEWLRVADWYGMPSGGDDDLLPPQDSRL